MANSVGMVSTSPMIEGVQPFLADRPKQIRNLVVGSAARTEVRDALRTGNLDPFLSLILGNPKSKDESMQYLLGSGSFDGRGACFGNARLDMERAEQFGLDFVFGSGGPASGRRPK
jgi:hypothetical protein